jgi:hypothetical protein
MLTCCRDVVTEAWEAVSAMKAEFKQQNDVHWEAECAFRAWRAADRERKCAASALSPP